MVPSIPLCLVFYVSLVPFQYPPSCLPPPSLNPSLHPQRSVPTTPSPQKSCWRFCHFLNSPSSGGSKRAPHRPFVMYNYNGLTNSYVNLCPRIFLEPPSRPSSLFSPLPGLPFPPHDSVSLLRNPSLHFIGFLLAPPLRPPPSFLISLFPSPYV